MRFRSHRFHESDLIAQIHGTRLRSRHAPPRAKLRFGERGNLARMRQHLGFDRQPAKSCLELRVGPEASSDKTLDIVRDDRFGGAYMFLASWADRAFAVDREHAPVHFIHSRVHADEHARIGNRDAARNRGKIGNADCRKICAERESLHDTDRDTHTRKRTRPAPIGNTIDLSQREPSFAQHFINHRQHEIGMPPGSFRRTLDSLPINPQCHRASLGRSVNREYLHIRTVMRITKASREKDTLAMAQRPPRKLWIRVMMENEIGRIVIDTTIEVHRELGPGLLETVYEAVLVQKLRERGLSVDRQVPIPIRYGNLAFDEGFRVDIIVCGKVVLELKCVEKLNHAHRKQLLTYLRLSGAQLGFSEALMKNGIVRAVNGLADT